MALGLEKGIPRTEKDRSGWFFLSKEFCLVGWGAGELTRQGAHFKGEI